MPQIPQCAPIPYDSNAILVAGLASALNTALNSSASELLLLVMILERTSGTVLDACCNLMLDINNQHIASLLVGHSFYYEFDYMVDALQKGYRGPGQKALIVCLKDAYSKMQSRSAQPLPPTQEHHLP